MKKAHNIKYYELIYVFIEFYILAKLETGNKKTHTLVFKCASINLNGADEGSQTPVSALARPNSNR